MSTEQEIKDHTRKIEAGERPCFCQACPHCAAEPEKSFAVHQCRRRTFRIVVEHGVRVYRSWVLRMKCPNCKRTFTDYPPFRFAVQAVRQRDLTRESERFFGNQKVLSADSARRTKVLGVRRPPGPSAGSKSRRTGAQQRLALALLAGRTDANATDRLSIDQPKRSA